MGKGLQAHGEDTVQTKHGPYARGEENEVHRKYGGYRLGTVYKQKGIDHFPETWHDFPEVHALPEWAQAFCTRFWDCGSVSREDTVPVNCKLNHRACVVRGKQAPHLQPHPDSVPPSKERIHLMDHVEDMSGSCSVKGWLYNPRETCLCCRVDEDGDSAFSVPVLDDKNTQKMRAVDVMA